MSVSASTHSLPDVSCPKTKTQIYTRIQSKYSNVENIKQALLKSAVTCIYKWL